MVSVKYLFRPEAHPFWSLSFIAFLGFVNTDIWFTQFISIIRVGTMLSGDILYPNQKHVRYVYFQEIKEGKYISNFTYFNENGGSEDGERD